MTRLVRLCSLLLTALTLSTIASRAVHAQCLTQWLYRVPITIDNSANANSLTDFQVSLTVNTQAPISQGKMLPTGADIRFVQDPDAGCTEVCHWVESGMNSGATTIWVKVPTIPASSTTTIYMYYGNSTAPSIANAECVFDMFDDFIGIGLDNSKWNSFGPGNLSFDGNTCTFNTPPGNSVVIKSVNSFASPVVSEMMVNNASGNWPNIAQMRDGTWDGYGPMMGGSQIRIGWTVDNAPDYAGNWNGSDVPTGAVAGVWQFTWAGTGDQRFTWPGGSISSSYNNYSLDGNVNIALGLLESGSGSMTVDWVRVRKYSAATPGTSVGAEETVTPPEIVTHPTSQAVCEGEPVTFTVEATGEALSYQWRKNGFALPGATEASYTIPAARAVDIGTYDVVVRGIVTSHSATLVVSTNTGIVDQPVGQTLCPGLPATLSITAAGTNLSYQWRKDNIDIPGAISETLVIPVVSEGDAGSYDCVVNGLCGDPATSAPAVIAVRPAPSIVTQPMDQDVCRGVLATFTVQATGEGLHYQWRRDGQPLEGATKPVLNIMAEPYSAGAYDVVITGTCEPSLTSAAGRLNVTLDPIITEQPVDRTISVGSNITYSIRVIGGGVISYQWQKDGRSIPGATTNTYTITNAGLNDVGEYSCMVRGTVCSDGIAISSNKASLILAVPPQIVKHPENQTLCEGNRMVLSVTAAGIGLNYQWRKGGTPINGATSRDLIVDGAATADAGTYDCVITGPGIASQLVTNAATVTVNVPASITAQPTDVTVCPGQPASFTVAAAGTNVTYRWYRNGQLIPGATSATYSVPAASAGDTGTYSAAIAGDCTDSVPSQAAHLVVNELPSITLEPLPATTAPGGTVTLVVAATGTNVTYQWRKNGTPIAGATTATLSITNAQPVDGGTYDCIVSGECAPADTSAAVNVMVGTSGVETIDATSGAKLAVTPHPATGVTRLDITLPREARLATGAELMLYDMTGRPALNLSEAFERSGFRTADFNAALLPSGVYYVRIHTDTWNGNLGTITVVK